MGSKVPQENEYNDCKVSIIIPFRDAGRYVHKALTDIAGQTHKNLEIICVNDNSTDSSAHIVNEFCKKDGRFVQVKGNGNGAGAARNIGLQYATGKYVCFLDADDMFESDMISAAVQLSEVNDLDICIWNGCEYNNDTGELKHETSILFSVLVPQENVFSGQESKYLFNMTNGAPWNKLYKKAFFDNIGLKYMEQKCFNDLYVTYGLMAHAKRISVIKEEKVKYRVNNQKSLQGTKELSIDNAFNAYEKLKELLIKDGLYQDNIKNSFTNMVLSSLIAILDMTKSYEAFKKIYSYMQENTILADDLGENDVYNQELDNYMRYKKIRDTELAKYAFEMNTIVVPPSNYQYLLDCEYSLQETRKSITYKIGLMITCVPRWLRKVIRK